MQDELLAQAERKGYIEGRNYLMDALSNAIQGDVDSKIVEFVWKFTKLHSDTNVEIR